MQTNVKVLGGLEITVEFDSQDLADEMFTITHITGKPVRENYIPQWLYDRIDAANEREKVLDFCYAEMLSSKYIQ